MLRSKLIPVGKRDHWTPVVGLLRELNVFFTSRLILTSMISYKYTLTQVRTRDETTVTLSKVEVYLFLLDSYFCETCVTPVLVDLI